MYVYERASRCARPGLTLTARLRTTARCDKLWAREMEWGVPLQSATAALRWSVVARRVVLTAVLALALAPAARGAAPVSVFPIPGSRLATPQTQITFRGLPTSQLGTIAVSGSRSGVHTGHVEADSDGRGGSFLPDHPFLPGEVVTVHTALNILDAHGGSFSFTVEQPAGNIYPPKRMFTPPRVSGDVRSFHSLPDFHPATVRIDRGRGLGPDVFLTPMRGPLQWGPMIVDGAGRLVWFDPLQGKQWASNLQVQRYRGQPVLTWWHGYLNAGVGKGEDVILNRHYQQIATVRAGNGLQADGHEFTITPQGTALITAFQLVHWNATAVGGLSNTPVQDAIVQEVDIATGLVVFQWDSLDHVPLTDGYGHATKHPRRPFDYFHVNSIQELKDGSLIISGRNTWALYEIDHQTGRVIWTLGGKDSSFAMPSRARTAYQHDGRLHPHGLLTVFDDGAWPKVHPQSRALLERLNMASRKVTVVRQLDHKPKLLATYEGSVQTLPHGNIFVGWGAAPYVTEYNRRGREIYDGHFVDGNSSYRAYRFAWSAQPTTAPALALHRGGPGIVGAYASWNGATDVASWRMLGGAQPSRLSPIATTRKRGFETPIHVRSGDRYFAVQALGGAGHVLATSAVKAR